MKHTITTRTADFCKIDTEFDGTNEEAVLEAKELMRLVEGGTGIGIRVLANLAVELVRTGGIKEGGNYELSANENLLLKEITKVLRDEKK